MTCSIEGCAKVVLARGWCSMHYNRWRNHGDPTIARTKAPDGEPQRWLHHVAATYQGDDCLRWPFAHIPNGYGTVLRDGGHRPAHRWVCEIVHGVPPSPDHEAAHACGVRDCVNPRHLRWATATENQADKLIHGTHCRGERSSSVKLTADQVQQIRRLRGEMPQVEIAAMFEVSRGAVTNILLGRSWGWLP